MRTHVSVGSESSEGPSATMYMLRAVCAVLLEGRHATSGALTRRTGARRRDARLGKSLLTRHVWP